MKYKAIIYDLDGTLLDSRPDILNTTKATIKYMGGRPLSDAEIYQAVGHGLEDLVKAALPEIEQHHVQRAVDFFEEHYYENCLVDTALYESAHDLLLEANKAGVKQAIHTNKPQRFTDKIMSGLEIENLFEVILGSHNGYPQVFLVLPGKLLSTISFFPEQNAFRLASYSLDGADEVELEGVSEQTEWVCMQYNQGSPLKVFISDDGLTWVEAAETSVAFASSIDEEYYVGFSATNDHDDSETLTFNIEHFLFSGGTSMNVTCPSPSE